MLDIEQFATEHQHTAELFTAIGTVGAVIVSLWLAARAARTGLKARASLKRLSGQEIDPQNAPTFLVLQVTNTGSVTLRLPAELFKWKVP